MSKIARLLCSMCVLSVAMPSFADDADQVAQVLKMRMVSIEVSIIELGEKPNPEETLDPESSKKLIARLRELEAQNKLAGLTRLRLATLENAVTSSQTGERAPVATGRNAFPGPRGGEGSASGTIFTMRDFGTLVTATPRIEPGDTIVMDLQIEKSAPVPDIRPPNPDNARPTGITPGRSLSTHFRSTVRVANGETVIVQGTGSSSKSEGDSRTIILVTARAEKTPPAAAKLSDDETQPALKVYHLRFAASADIAQLLGTLFANKRVKIASDNRTNSLVVSGDSEDQKVMEAVISLLDENPTVKTGDKKKPAE